MKRLATVLLLVAALAASTAFAQAQRWEYGILSYSENIASPDPRLENSRSVSFMAPGVLVASSWVDFADSDNPPWRNDRMVREAFVEKLSASYAIQPQAWWAETMNRGGWVTVVHSILGARGWELVTHSVVDTPYGVPWEWEDGFISRRTTFTFKRPLQD